MQAGGLVKNNESRKKLPKSPILSFLLLCMLWNIVFHVRIGNLLGESDTFYERRLQTCRTDKGTPLQFLFVQRRALRMILKQ